MPPRCLLAEQRRRGASRPRQTQGLINRMGQTLRRAPVAVAVGAFEGRAGAVGGVDRHLRQVAVDQRPRVLPHGADRRVFARRILRVRCMLSEKPAAAAQTARLAVAVMEPSG